MCVAKSCCARGSDMPKRNTKVLTLADGHPQEASAPIRLQLERLSRQVQNQGALEDLVEARAWSTSASLCFQVGGPGGGGGGGGGEWGKGECCTVSPKHRRQQTQTQACDRPESERTFGSSIQFPELKGDSTTDVGSTRCWARG